jgi:hypothetical protein
VAVVPPVAAMTELTASVGASFTALTATLT